MTDFNREDLIHALADTVGLTQLNNTAGSFFDSGTGTLYVSGSAITKTTIQEALRYFENMLNGRIVDESVKTYYKTAVEAIKLMIEEKQ